jgi:hypothetical protein
MAPEGADDPSGSWTIEIPELSYSLGNGSPDTRVEGLWTLTVTVP